MAYLPQFGFGAVDPNSGTYQDVNCPFYCWAAGNVLDMELFGNHCWPCHNICPPSQPWDTTNLVCSGSPQTQGSLPAISPSGDGSGCPAGTAWNAADGLCETTGPNYQNILMYAAIGLTALLGAVVIAKK